MRFISVTPIQSLIMDYILKSLNQLKCIWIKKDKLIY